MPLHVPWDAEDLELFFHYLSSLCSGLGLGDKGLWKDRVPRLAFRRHGVLRLILAVSALHLARQEPHRRHPLEERAEVHFTIGLRRTTDILPSLDAENCAELYESSILVCICSFAKRPRPGNLLLVAEGSEVSWWKLFKGVRIAIETFGIPTLFSDELGPMPSDVAGGQPDDGPHGHGHSVDLKMVEWEDALGRLCALISTCRNERQREACQSASNMLMWCFQETYGSTTSPKPAVDAKFNTVMAWLYCLPDDFIGYMCGKEPIPLIILAHFTVLLNNLDSVWFMNGWSSHVLRGVTETLEPAWNEWLKWPTLQIEQSREVVMRTGSCMDSEMII
ncbi:uncharacterized protein DNG_10036 [Cephalotrichum gorgonifer]|uniref:C6 transcription factor n=1 Tax=Cephalotrichum gorgonifer TaxID=2041049 RepID=A0AAE8N6Z6_9PEZI|nr:uncharacterized protein DNG_10036 [Cephalotrichum gorgonifer]